MTRLKKELINRGIVFDSADTGIYDCYEAEEQLVEITDDFIITCYYCNVLEPQLKLYDKNFNLIGQQSTEKDEYFFGEKSKNPWSSAIA